MQSKRIHITPDAVPNDGILFVDHRPTGRSGHMGHALVEYEAGKLLAFYPNCSAEDERYHGHSGFGWMEYKRSTDGGLTWSEPIIEPNSKALFDQNVGRTFMCEKAVKTDSGRILLFYLNCDVVTNGHIWEPYFEPYYAYSTDQGKSFSEPCQLFDARGRVYDAIVRDGKIYVLFMADPELPGLAHNGSYDMQLYVSEDDGESFTLRSKVAFSSTCHCFYGTMCFMQNGDLIVYTYEDLDEHNLKYIISHDDGRSWDVNRRAFFEKRLRNPQMAYLNGLYIMHGRGGHPQELYGSLVLYTSPDGICWDAGTYLRYHLPGTGAGAYSNNVTVHLPDGTERLMIQSSFAYEDHKTNTIMYFVDVE